MIGDDWGFLLIVSDAAHCPFGVLAGFADAQANSIGRHFLTHPPFPTRLLCRLQVRRLPSPTQNRPACGGCFVEAAARAQPGRRMKTRGVATASLGGER